MNKDIIKGNWKELKGKIKQEWSKLTDDEVTHMEGTYDELEGVLQKNYGYKKEEAKEAIDKFIDKQSFKDAQH